MSTTEALTTINIETGKIATRLLHDGWTARVVGGPAPEHIVGQSVPASVPGSIHTDLLSAGLIADPYLDDNERLQAWIGACDWEYRTTFQWSGEGHDRVELLFEGLDTIARVELNNEVIAETRNMHRTYCLDVQSLLHEGTNDLSITFSSPVRYADRESLEQGYRPHVNHHPYNSIRKMACSFGWDWGPDTATVGVWRPVTLRSWSSARLDSVKPMVTMDGSDGIATVSIEIAVSEPSAHSARVTVGTVSSIIQFRAGETVAKARIVVPDAERWWPIGHGDHPLYDLEVILNEGEMAQDSWQGRIGFRTVRVDTEPDELGTPFTIIVNDRPIYIKGANWIPDDAFLHRVDRARYE